MPRSTKGIGRKPGGTARSKQKALTGNAAFAAARDERAAADTLRALAGDPSPQDCCFNVLHRAREEQPVASPPETMPIEPKRRKWTQEQEELRRQSVYYFFDKLGCPPESEWDGEGGTVSQIANAIWLERGLDRRPIRRTMERIVAGEPLASYNGTAGVYKITRGEALIISDCLRSGVGQWQAMHNINMWRDAKGKGAVSRSCVREAAFCETDMQRLRRGTESQGTYDPARLLQGCAREARDQVEHARSMMRHRMREGGWYIGQDGVRGSCLCVQRRRHW